MVVMGTLSQVVQLCDYILYSSCVGYIFILMRWIHFYRASIIFVATSSICIVTIETLVGSDLVAKEMALGKEGPFSARLLGF